MHDSLSKPRHYLQHHSKLKKLLGYSAEGPCLIYHINHRENPPVFSEHAAYLPKFYISHFNILTFSHFTFSFLHFTFSFQHFRTFALLPPRVLEPLPPRTTPSTPMPLHNAHPCHLNITSPSRVLPLLLPCASHAMPPLCCQVKHVRSDEEWWSGALLCRCVATGTRDPGRVVH